MTEQTMNQRVEELMPEIEYTQADRGRSEPLELSNCDADDVRSVITKLVTENDKLRAALAADAVHVKWESRTRPTWDEKFPWTPWVECSEESVQYMEKLPNMTHSNGWQYETRKLYAAGPRPATVAASFQSRVAPWIQECFGPEIATDRIERFDRFIEEALELVQSLGMPANRVHALVDYVYKRPVGQPFQEVGGTMVTLAALCLSWGLDMHQCAEIELARINQPDVIIKIRAKHANGWHRIFA